MGEGIPHRDILGISLSISLTCAPLVHRVGMLKDGPNLSTHSQVTADYRWMTQSGSPCSKEADVHLGAIPGWVSINPMEVRRLY